MRQCNSWRRCRKMPYRKIKQLRALGPPAVLIKVKRLYSRPCFLSALLAKAMSSSPPPATVGRRATCLSRSTAQRIRGDSHRSQSARVPICYSGALHHGVATALLAGSVFWLDSGRNGTAHQPASICLISISALPFLAVFAAICGSHRAAFGNWIWRNHIGTQHKFFSSMPCE